MNLNENNQRVVDYFAIIGLPANLLNKTKKTENDEEEFNHSNTFELHETTGETSRKLHNEKNDPIVELAILDKTLNERVPHGFECLWLTKAGHSANLNYSDSLFKTHHELFLCIRRGRDKPPITDIGVFYEGGERVMVGCDIITKTVGNNSANVNNSSFTGDRIFITYRRSHELACNSLAVIDVTVIIKSKGELAPHTFLEIPKNLNRGLFGASIFLCYKKAWISAPQINYLPTILYRYPLTDHQEVPFPSEVGMFGLPMGAVIESWPTSSNSNNIHTKPSFSTFILNVNSVDSSIVEKVYGAGIIFFEPYSDSKINHEQSLHLEYSPNTNKTLHSNKCLMLLSRSPLFDSFRDFLYFLYDHYTKRITLENIIPIEKYLSHIIYNVPYPTFQKPQVLVNLTENEQDCLSIYLLEECVLPQSGASFIDLLLNFGVDNSINVFLLVLLQQNVMIHSLRRAVLTGVVEALSCIIFPFIWRMTYLPMCPLNLWQLMEAPGSFILGMDSRYFDLFHPPENVICVDLDTNTLSWKHDRNDFNIKILPKKPLSTLQNHLRSIYNSLKENPRILEGDPKLKKTRRQFDLSIREAFLKFMISILHNYKQFLRMVTRRPDIKAIDRNLTTFFDCEGFIQSKEKSSENFYRQLIKTQLFYDCIMNFSFATELEPSLAESFDFFSKCCSKMHFKHDEERLLELNEKENHQTIVILPPQYQYNIDGESQMIHDENKNQIYFKDSSFIYNLRKNSFPHLKFELGISNEDLNSTISSVNSANYKINENNQETKNSNFLDTQSSYNTQNQLLLKSTKFKVLSTPIGVRTKAEKLQSLKHANNFNLNEKNCFLANKTHAMCLLSNAYALWFIYLSECLKVNEDLRKVDLNQAYQVLIQMQNHQLQQPDEICYRTIMQLCLLYKLPTLAVKTLIHMKIYNIELTPITYSYYNKALIDPSNWPSFEQDRWAKIRLLWSVIWAFKYGLKIKKEREERAKKKSRRKSRQNTINRNKSSTSKAEPELIKTKNKIEDIQTLDTNNILKKSELDTKENCFKLNEKNQHTNIYNHKYQSIEKDSTIMKHSFKFDYSKLISSFFNSDKKCFQIDLISQETGILIISKKLETKLKHLKPQMNKSIANKISNCKSVDFLDLNGLNKRKTSIIKKTIIDDIVSSNSIDDPLGAFSKFQNSKDSLSFTDQIEINETKKRLFDYEPFANYNQPTNKPDNQINSKIDYDFEKHIKLDEEEEERYNRQIFHRYGLKKDLDDKIDDYDDDEDEDEYDDEYDDDDDDDDDDEDDNDDDENDDEDILYANNHLKNDHLQNNLKETNESIQSFNSNNSFVENSMVTSSKSNQLLENLKNPYNNLNNQSNEGKISKNKQNIDTTPPSSSNNLFTSIKKKMDSIDINRIKGIITERSTEIKAIMTNVTPLNQHDLTSRLKSFSGYQLNTAYNHLTKSASNQFTPKNNQPKNKISQNNLDKNYLNLSSINLEPITDDDSFKPLTLKWWDFQYDGRLVTDESVIRNTEFQIKDDILIDVQMSSCNFCENCRSFLYDEEIMSGWTLNDSDLNIKCCHCLAHLVPKLYIIIKDMNAIRTLFPILKNAMFDSNDKKDQNITFFKTHPFNDLEDSVDKNETKPQKILHTNEYTVQYLSPLVIRKEIENIILIKEQDHQNESLISDTLMEDHSVIFFNLLWYFKRIGTDSSYLLDILLKNRINWLQENILHDNDFKIRDWKTLKNILPKSKIIIRLNCMWDNIKLQNSIKTYETPLYLSWLNSDNQHIQKQIKERLITVLTLDEIKSIKKSLSNPRSQLKLIELVIRNIKDCDVGIPIKNIIRERFISRTNYSSIYREILFLVLVALERYLIDIDVFDNEYRKAYKRILNNDPSKSLFKSFDKPPNNLAVWCRRLFSPLCL